MLLRHSVDIGLRFVVNFVLFAQSCDAWLVKIWVYIPASAARGSLESAHKSVQSAVNELSLIMCTLLMELLTCSVLHRLSQSLRLPHSHTPPTSRVPRRSAEEQTLCSCSSICTAAVHAGVSSTTLVSHLPSRHNNHTHNDALFYSFNPFPSFFGWNRVVGWFLPGPAGDGSQKTNEINKSLETCSYLSL